jgi:hypothetical protein
VAHVGQKKNTKSVLIGQLEVKDYLEDLEVDGRLILKLFLNWIYLSRDIDKRFGVLNTVRNLRVPSDAGNLLTEKLIYFKRLYSSQSVT